MRRLLLTMLLLLIFVTPQAWAALKSKYPDPERQTMWNNLTDKMHSLGQSPKQAALTKMRLHNERAIVRTKDINRVKKQAWLNGRS